AGFQVDGRGLAGAEGVGRAQRDSVHAGRVERRRGAAGPHRLGGHPPRGLRQRHPARREPGRAATGLARGTPGIEGAGGGDVVEERAAGHDRNQRYSVTSTSVPEPRPVASSGTTTYPSAEVRIDSSADSPNNGTARPSSSRTWI